MNKVANKPHTKVPSVLLTSTFYEILGSNILPGKEYKISFSVDNYAKF